VSERPGDHEQLGTITVVLTDMEGSTALPRRAMARSTRSVDGMP
jgi:hypothetical protein